MVLLNEHPLDMTSLNYGGWSSKMNLTSYKPGYREEAKKFEHGYRVWVGSIIYQVTKDEHAVFLSEQQDILFTLFMKEQMKRDWNIKAFNEEFNYYTYEYIMYSEKFIEILKTSGEWWLTVQSGEYLPLDANPEREEKLKQLTQKKLQKNLNFLEAKGIEVEGFEIRKKYDDKHYISEEWDEIRDMVNGTSGINPNLIIPHQSRRVLIENVNKKRMKDYKEVKLKSTGRKMLMDVYPYGWSFIETEPVVK